MAITLKVFQETAVADLRKQFLELWKTTNRKLPLIFKSPTGSGKTAVVAQFLKDLSNDPQFDLDKGYLWFSFSEESYEQSKDKLFEYINSKFIGKAAFKNIQNAINQSLERDLTSF